MNYVAVHLLKPKIMEHFNTFKTPIIIFGSNKLICVLDDRSLLCPSELDFILEKIVGQV